MNIKKADISIGTGLCVFAVVVFSASFKYKGMGASVYGPHVFPQIIAVALFLCSLGVIALAVMNKSIEPDEVIDKKGLARSGISILICILYIFIMQFIGFTVATALFLFGMMTFVGQKNLIVRFAVSIGVTLGVLLLFKHFLNIPLPEADFTLRY